MQPLPVSENEIIEAKIKSKRYTIKVTPQKKGAIEFNKGAAITVYVNAGSKEEAFECLSQKITKYYAFHGDSNSNTAECGKWYNGDKCFFEILKFEKNAKNCTTIQPFGDMNQVEYRYDN